MRTISETKQIITQRLKDSGKYNPALELQIDALAGILRSYELATADIESLETTVVEAVTKYGVKLEPHPAFKVQRDALDAMLRQLKSLGLTVADLVTDNNDDPLLLVAQKAIDMTRGRSLN